MTGCKHFCGTAVRKRCGYALNCERRDVRICAVLRGERWCEYALYCEGRDDSVIVFQAPMPMQEISRWTIRHYSERAYIGCQLGCRLSLRANQNYPSL